MELHGLPVSSPERTFAELASMLTLVELVIVGDHLVRHSLSTRTRLELLSRNSPLPGRSHARAAAALVRDRVDSPLETKLRLLLVLAGLPEPVTNYELRSATGELRRRHDLALPDQRLAFEAQGRHHIEVAANWEKDLDRLEESNIDGWRTVQVTSKNLHRTPSRVVTTAWRAMKQCGVPGVPARPADQWRKHFG